LDVRDREFVVLLGPSGCGKTTLLNTVAGLELPDSGSITIGGDPVDGVGPAERDLGFVFQNYAIYPHKTVYGNLAFALKFRPVKLESSQAESATPSTKDVIDARVREIARMLRLDSLLDRYPGQLSGGQRQRVAMGRALVRRPRAFLFDEPLSNLDAGLRTTVRSEIKGLQRSLGATILYVTHDQVEAMTLADRIVVMKEGQVLQEGTPAQIYGRPESAFVATFVGSSPMSLILGRFTLMNDGSLAFQGAGAPCHVPELLAGQYRTLVGRDVILGVRAEGTGFADRFSSTLRIRGVVADRDYLGHATFVRVSVGSFDVRVLVEDGVIPKEGEEVSVFLDMARTHVFDAATERAVALVAR
jgi:multiple sugar transport system ATP-binding protein